MPIRSRAMQRPSGCRCGMTLRQRYDPNMRCYTRACFVEMPKRLRAARANYSDRGIKLPPR
jgi:hypothetical protein